MKLSAIFQKEEFLGVVASNEVEELMREAGIADYRQVDDIRIEQRSDCRGQEGIVYWDCYEQIDDLQGGMGNTVVKN